MTRAIRLPAALAVLLLPLAAAAAAAQAGTALPPLDQPGQPDRADSSSSFFERVEVNVVNVEVWVADRDGNRVTGLTPEDFQVTEDGKPVEVTNFYTVEWADSLLATPKVDAVGRRGRGDSPPPNAGSPRTNSSTW